MSFRDRLLQLAAVRHCRGRSVEQIDNLERQCNVNLPAAYRQFLEIAGDGLEGFFVGSDYDFGQLLDLQKAANDLLAENHAGSLPRQAFVFLMHQGYQFYFFIGNEVYYYIEGGSSFEKRFDSFEDLFESAISRSNRKLDGD